MTLLRLRDGVQRVDRENGDVLLVAQGGGAVRLSRIAASLHKPLLDGATLEQLTTLLRVRHPGIKGVEEKVQVFLDQLRKGQLVDEVGVANVAVSTPTGCFMIDADPVALPIAKLLGAVPRFLGIGIAVLAVAGFLALSLSPAQWPRLSDVVRTHDMAGIAFVLFFSVPAHELAHAVAARLAGVPAGKLGIRFRPFGFPRPYLATPYVYRVAKRGPRCLIPLAGPLMDLVVGGVAAWLLAFGPSQSAELVLTYTIISFSVGTSPLPNGDGSHTIEALFSDETLRLAAVHGLRGRFTRPAAVRAYRWWTAVHCLCAGVVIGGLAR